MIEHKMTQEQFELYLEAVSYFTKHCGSILFAMSNHLPKDSMEKKMYNDKQIRLVEHMITHEMESSLVIKDIDTLYHIQKALKYYGDLLHHTKYIFLNIYKESIPQYILAKEMLISQNIFCIKQHLVSKTVAEPTE